APISWLERITLCSEYRALECSCAVPVRFGLRRAGQCLDAQAVPGSRIMFLSWLRSRPAQTRRRATFRPMLEALGERINPTSPHFISATSSVDGSGALVVKFKEAGLGDNQLINYELTGNVNATFQFQNNGGNIVQGTPFFAVDVTLATGTFNSG